VVNFIRDCPYKFLDLITYETSKPVSQTFITLNLGFLIKIPGLFSCFLLLSIWAVVFPLKSISQESVPYLEEYISDKPEREKLESIFQASVSPLDRIRALNKLAIAYRRPDPRKAAGFIKTSLEVKGLDEENLDVAESYNILANIYFDQGKYGNALDNYSKSISICERYKDNNRVAHNYNDIGYVYHTQEIYDLAIRNYQRAAKAFIVEEKDDDLAITYNNLGQTYLALNEYNLAEEYFIKALELRQRKKDSVLIAHSHTYLGLLAEKKGEPEHALELFNLCLRVFHRYNDYWLEAHTSNYLGNLHYREGFYDKALKNYQQALILFKKSESVLDIANTLIYIGDVKFMDHDLIEGLAYARNALNIAMEFDLLTVKEAAYLLLSNIYTAAGDENKSMEFYKKYSQVKDSIFSRNFSNAIAETEFKQASVRFEEDMSALEKENRMERLVVIFAVIISILLLVFSFMLFWWNRNQKRANALLKERSQILNRTLKNLAISEEKYKSLFSKANDAIFLMDHEIFIDCNDKTLEIFECEREDIVSKSPGTFSPEFQPDGTPSVLKAANLIEKAIQGEPQRFYWLHNKKNGARFDAEVSLSTVTLEEKTFVLAIVRDISEQKKAETELIIAREIAEKATKSKTEFLAKMSHEIRTPLGGIISTVDICADSGLNDKQMELLGIIKTSANSLLSIVNEILDFSKIESGRIELSMRTFSLRSFIREIVAVNKIIANEKGIGFQYNIGNNVPDIVKGDDFRLGQILSNFVSNALKFTLEGEVKINVFLISENKNTLRIKFEVIDTGIGIAEEQSEKLFKEYSQGDSNISRTYGGTGLGLTIAKGLIQRMGGQIGVESILAKGSTFWFIVELETGNKNELVEIQNTIKTEQAVKVPVSQKVQNIPEEKTNKTSRFTILLAEDNPINQKVTQINLNSLGHDVEVAGNGLIALEKYKEKHFDVILMDIQMPEMDGLEATVKIREFEKENPDRSRVKIIALTANVLSKEAESCYKAGMDDFISKPFKPEDLKRAIEGDSSTNSAG